LDNVATKESVKNSPIVKEKRVIISEIASDTVISFSQEQYLKLQEGLIPKAMEDKWFIYFENDSLYFHRSWTGLGIYRAEIIKEDIGEDKKYAIKEFYLETDEEIYKDGDNKFDLDILLQLIFCGLLGIDTRNSFIEKYGEGTSGTMLIWSLFGRMFFPE